MSLTGKKHNLTAWVLLVILAVYFAMICIINFFAPPGCYDSDMYTDIRYAVEAWEHKSIFPEGWVFGNQLYVMSTPVLAGFFYGLTGAEVPAMGLASSVMAALVLLSFIWMIAPVIPSWEGRLTGAVLFLGMMLFFGDAWHDPTGWQLMFTMCSYYACYAVNAFLVYGCYLRCDRLRIPQFGALLALCCVFSFATGIQSLRQTAVMTLPLLAVTILEALWMWYRKQPVRTGTMLTAGTVSAANILGLITARCMNIEQVEIIGELNLIPLSDFFENLKQGILLMLSLILNYDPIGIAAFAGILLLGVLSFFVLMRKKKGKAFVLSGLLLFSVLAILAVDTLTTMQVRSIYYFMLYPLIAVLAGWLISESGKQIRSFIVVFLAVLVFASWYQEIPGVMYTIREEETDEVYEISSYLTENGYTTLYGAWNQGADIAIASGGRLSAGFWEYREDPFFFYKYLCNPDIFRADSSGCVYLFYGEEDAQRGVEKAKTQNVEMTLLRHFPDRDIYLYTAPVNLMEVFW